jgi:hypothetical protein
MKIERIEQIANNMKDTDGKVSANELVERLNSKSFWELLSETSKIQIPIIQRDYAQGRENEKTNKIRFQFLKNIIEAIESEKGSLELDFVYGNVENDIFQPLDGQQRLTTLFLLHWYLALKTGDLQNTKDRFCKFTYETRISSREFCNELVDNGEFLGEGETISEKICDSKWFFLSWKKDPTIKAMLVMLDSIEERLNGKNAEELKNFWQKLTSENPPITFYFKQLNDIGLTDDLYIKMNARGKGLTDFENFKARFEKHIEINEWEKDIANPTHTFSHKIDTVWTDLFWKHRGNDNLIDNEIVKFIAGIAIFCYAQNLQISDNSEEELSIRKHLEEKKEKSITDEAVKRERIERRISTLFNNPAEVSPEDFPTKDTFEYLKKCFDVYSENNNDELLPNNLPLWGIIETTKVKINSNTEIESNLFIEFFKGSEITSYSQRVLFFAQTQYLLSNEELNSELFSEWMRVVRNIVQNSTIDSASSFISAINLLKEIKMGCKNIYDYLSRNTVTAGHGKSQVRQEIEKAKLIVADKKNSLAIHSIEDINFCKGDIDFAMYCIDYDIDKSQNVAIFDVEKLNTLKEIIKKDLDIDKDITDDFKRAFLTIKENDYFEVWGSWSWSFDCNKYWLLWKNNDLIQFAKSKDWKRDYLKDLLDRRMQWDYSTICDKYEIPLGMPLWKEKLIKQKVTLEGATFILIPNDNSYCKLAWQQKPSREDQIKKIK